MIQTLQSTDDLTLSLIKEHLNIEHNLDDTLLTSYQEASLKFTQEYTKDYVLKTTLTSEDYENIVIGNILVLKLKYTPNKITITTSSAVPSNILTKSYSYNKLSTTTSIKPEDNFYSYIDSSLMIDVSNIKSYNSTITYSVTVECGSDPINKNINQARLILIAGWYKDREPSTNLNVNKLPYSVGALLDLSSRASI